MQTCKLCEQRKPLEAFYKHKRTGPDTRCKDCVLELRMLALYGVSREEYLRMVETQGGCCLICELPVKLYIDHDHTSGEVRGLLCNKCNTAIGMLDEDVDRFRRAAEYLLRSQNLLEVE